MRIAIFILLLKQTTAFWDEVTTTTKHFYRDKRPQQSFFRWQRIEFANFYNLFWGIDWDDISRRRRICVMAGLSYEMLPITVATILNRRTLITAANPMDIYMDKQHDIRIWALGRGGTFLTPFRYRVWKIKRVLPKSNNPEHWHGIRGIHQPRHDLAIIFSQDQLALSHYWPTRYHYAYKAFMNKDTLIEDMFFAGSGWQNMQHIIENYKIMYSKTSVNDVVDCSIYLPKWWGKFICMINRETFPAIQSGSALLSSEDPPRLYGVGSFEIRYNDDRIWVYTDLRYYLDFIMTIAAIEPGDYYEYAYPEYSMTYGWFWDSTQNDPKIPWFLIRGPIFPLG